MKKYNIPSSKINKSVRWIGSIVRRMSPHFTAEMFYEENKILDKFLKGHWLSFSTKVKTQYITRKDGSKLRVLVCKSRKKRKTNQPVTGLLWMHGGGYAIGLPEQDFLFANQFCKDGSCVAILPDYTRSTEEPYPSALEDCYLALQWMWKKADKYGINREQIFVGGNSAGGGLAAAVCLYARDQRQIPIAFHMPLYPMLDDREITESSRNNDAPVWNTMSNRVGWDLYLRNWKNRENISCYAAPARATNYAGLPPCCTYVGTIDPFYDETITYCEELRKEDIAVHLKVFDGCFHAFDLMGYPTKPAREARKFLQAAFKFAQKHYFTEVRTKIDI